MRVARLTSGVVAIVLAAAAVEAAAPGTSAPCGPGSTAAAIAGARACLKAGGRCVVRRDAAYHRYRFHCHVRRLRAFAPPVPRTSPDAPPQLPAPPTTTVGALVDVGGYRLFLECAGAGSPTVVFEAGATANSTGYKQLQYALAAETRVCTYDRPGTELSRSERRPAAVPPTSETFARELHTALANANVPGPYVLAGGSFGGILISAFAAHYLDEVAGLVYFDGFAPGTAASYGRTLNPVEPWDGRADFARLNALDLGSRPVVVLGTTYLGEAADLRRRTTNLIAAEAPQYGHVVSLDAPGLVYELVRVVVAAVRSGEPLPPCARTVIARLVRRCTP
jgi:pimeloyl-ACP methyl ester carboxylesterase